MRNEGEDIEAQRKSVGVGEAGRDKDTSRLEVDGQDTRLDERQQQAVAEVERVVRGPGMHRRRPGRGCRPPSSTTSSPTSWKV